LQKHRYAFHEYIVWIMCVVVWEEQCG